MTEIKKESDMEEIEDREYRLDQKIAAVTIPLELALSVTEKVLGPTARIDFVILTETSKLELHTEINSENAGEIAKLVTQQLNAYDWPGKPEEPTQ